MKNRPKILVTNDDGYDNIYKNDGPSEAAPFTFNCIEEFLFFVSKGIEYWFDADVMKHWCNLPNAVGAKTGWEHFMLNTVRPEYNDWDSNGRPALSLGAEALK